MRTGGTRECLVLNLYESHPINKVRFTKSVELDSISSAKNAESYSAFLAELTNRALQQRHVLAEW